MGARPPEPAPPSRAFQPGEPMATFRLLSPSTLFLLVLGEACAPTDKPADQEEGQVTADTDGDGYVADDCAPADPAIHPGALEVCDGVDNNCDGNTDEGVIDTYFADEDGDGFGNPETPVMSCATPEGAVPNDADCDDTAAARFPSAPEVCDGVDNDCDGELDEELGTLSYLDSDGDGFGDPETELVSCESDADRVEVAGDCDDGDPARAPGATELCNDVDDDCDEEVDEDLERTFYRDLDADGVGVYSSTIAACEAPEGFVETPGDCDDVADSIYPGAPEFCNGHDDDCDGSIDEDGAVDGDSYWLDLDLDGFGDVGTLRISCSLPAGYVADDQDCDDTLDSVNPAADERCDGRDNNCDGVVDEPEAVDAARWYTDGDGDGFGQTGVYTDACTAPYRGVVAPGDCDDTRATVNPAATEVCNTRDDDCDSVVDEDTAVDAGTWYADLDGDGYGVDTSLRVACTAPALHSGTPGDCDDALSAVNPAASEVCNGLDDDCDGSTDGPDALDADPYFVDADGDGFGDSALPVLSCTARGLATNDQDCDDGEAEAFPGSTATEVPFDGIDTDCDGQDWCTDLDCDGVADLLIPEHYDGDYITTSFLQYAADGYADSGRTGLSTRGVYDAWTGDLDQDGYPDVVFANYFDGSVTRINSRIYWGGPSGHSTADVTDLPTLGTVDLLVEDLDADGWLDLVFATYWDSTLGYTSSSYVYWGSSAGYSTTDRTALPTSGAWKSATADLNADGHTDLVFCSYHNGSYAINSPIYWGSAAGYSSGSVTNLPTLGCRDLAIADLNEDGWPDITFANHYNGSSYANSSYLYWGSASGFSTAYRESLPTHGALSVAAQDFDLDGHIDLAFGGYHNVDWSTPAYTYIYWNASFGFLSTNYTAFDVRGTYQILAEDLNLDGYAELVLSRYLNGSTYSTNSVILWGSASRFTWANRLELPTVGSTHATAADLDQDGYPELLFGGYFAGSWASGAPSYVYWGNPSSTPYSTADRTVLSNWGTWQAILVSGPQDW
jgi:hypothetical protein